MNLKGFDVSVPEAREETSSGYVVLRHCQNFTLRLHNAHKYGGVCKPADAEIFIQGRHVGTFRVAYGQTVTLERPLNDCGKFTAYKNDTQEARDAGIDPHDEDNGLITVVWHPGSKRCFDVLWNYATMIAERPIVTWDSGYNNITYDYNTAHNNTATYGATRSMSMSCHSGGDLCGGGVGLSGHSDQAFTSVGSLDYDEPSCTIHLRLAFDEHRARPVRDTCVYRVCETKKPRPLR